MGSCSSGGKRKTITLKPNLNKDTHPETDTDLVEYLTKTHTSSVSAETAVLRTNPNYDVSMDYKMNCQRCVWAYELQRRGYDVEALPTFKGDDLPRQGNWMNLSKNARQGNTKYVGRMYGQTNSVKTEISNITEAMNDWGDGSRAIVRVVWKNQNMGHVFNIENVGGVIRAFDGQTGKEIRLRDYLSKARRGYTSLVRSDNADLDMNEISKYVKIRGGK